MSTFLAPARPRTVTITLWGVFLLGIWNAARAVTLGWRQGLWQEIGAGPDPRLRLLVALFWAGMFWGVALALRRRHSSTRWSIPVLLFLYALSELGDRLFLAKSAVAQRAWLLYTIFHLATILFALWALNRAAARSYFRQG